MKVMYIYIMLYIFNYSTLDIFTMIFLGTLLFHAVLRKPITLVVIATGQTFQFSRVFTAFSYRCTLLNRFRADNKISAGNVGSPNNQLYAVSYPTSCTNYGSEDI